MLLKYNLIPLDKAFVFQVLGQDENLSEYVRNIGVFRASNGWDIAISERPEINCEKQDIYLRGYDSDKDLYIHRNYNFPSNYQRDQVMNAVNEALRELVDSFKSYKSSAKKYRYNPLAHANVLRENPVNVTEEVIVVRLW